MIEGTITIQMLLAGAAALGLAGCKKEAAAPLPPPIVQVMEVVPTNVPMTTEMIGQLDSPENVEIRARVEGSKLRLRPILMTSFAFILGCVPLMLASGSVVASRSTMGTGEVFGA